MLIGYREVLHRAKILATTLLLFVLLVFVASFLAFLRTPLIEDDAKPESFIFPMGSSIVNLTEQTRHWDVAQYPAIYVPLLAWMMNAANHLHAGEYIIQPGETILTLLQDMVAGRVVWRDFLFVEGWTLKQLRDALDSNTYLIHKTKGLTDAQLSALLKIPQKNPEGLFFPDTYRYTAGIPDILILRQAYQAMQKHLNDAWATREAGLPYQNPYQALIVASLVEKEAEIKQDRPKIAGVILKRLKMGMILQIDASVIYGLGSAFDGRLKLSQLKIPTPYNTYLNKGLPPTPIAMPGEASIQAATHPEIGSALYYVADGRGGHIFSATMIGQNRAVERYRNLEHHEEFREREHTKRKIRRPQSRA